MNRPVAVSRVPADTGPAISDVIQLVDTEMQQLDDCIRGRLRSDVSLINQIAEYIIYSGGKRIRPLLLILCAKACRYQGQLHILLAAVVEFIHTATLLHDDVVDESELRRGQKTAHALWGNAASVLVGDFLYSRSFQMMVEMKSMRVMRILAETTNNIAEGEVMQLLNLGDPEVDEERYMDVIRNKTARLFEAACQLAAVIGKQPFAIEQGVRAYGNALGRAFQIADDILDYESDADTIGKNIGDDLAEGKPTLPLIYARMRAGDAGRRIIDQAIRSGGTDKLDQVLEIIHTTGALASARQTANTIAGEAINQIRCLPASEHRDALEALARYSVNRQA